MDTTPNPLSPESAPATPLDPAKEFAAMSSIATTLMELPEASRGRVLEYMMKMFAVAPLPATKASAPAVATTDPAPEVARTFEDFPALLSAARAETNTDRALLAGYFVQVVQGEPDFDAFSANKELRHSGYESANITRDLDSLMQRSPSLVMQTRKLGNTKQARKQYRLTAAGIQAAKDLLRG